MNESHTCLKFWWAPHHRTIFLTYYYCWFSLALFRRAYCAFNVFFFLIDSTRICVFTKSWRLILNWNMDGKILDSFHSWCEFHQKITRIHQTDAGIPWHSHMRHAVGNIEMCKQLNGWALPLLFFLLFLLTMVLVLVLLLLPLFFRMDHIRALFIARLSVLCSHCIILLCPTLMSECRRIHACLAEWYSVDWKNNNRRPITNIDWWTHQTAAFFCDLWMENLNVKQCDKISDTV